MLTKKSEAPFSMQMNVWGIIDYAQQEVRISVPYKAERKWYIIDHAQQEVRISVPYKAECMAKN